MLADTSSKDDAYLGVLPGSPQDFPGDSDCKVSAYNAGDPGQEDLLEKEMANHSSILAWKIPWMEKPGRLQSVGSQRFGHDWATWLSRFSQVLSMAHIPTLVPWECEFHQDKDFCLLSRRFHFWYPRTVSASLTSVTQSRPALCDPMDCNTPGFSAITNWMASHFSILALRTPWTVWKKNSA